jgi:SAM-dependent methyltransferase
VVVEYMKLYSELASWWHLFSSPEDYREEADFFHKLLIDYCDALPKTLLELGSGGGNNASHLKSHFEMTLIDLSSEMLKMSREMNPECEHIEGDMRTVRLGRIFDAVFIHDAIMYMTTEQDLRRAIDTAFAHCKPGGVAVLAPDFVRETFKPSTDHGGEDGDGCGIRYLEWTLDPDPTDNTYQVNYAYIIKERDGSVWFDHEQHLEGLFGREDWKRLLTEAGFEPEVVRDNYDRDIFIGKKPTRLA